MKTLHPDRLQSLLDTLPQRTIGLVGDLFLDRYLEIEEALSERSLETGLEAYQVSRIRNAPGALGTVISNLAALGVGRLVPVTVIGQDGHGFDLLQSLSNLPVDIVHILQRPERLTPTYTKPLYQPLQGDRRELNRLDVRQRGPLSQEATLAVQAALRLAFAECDAWIVLDQVNEPQWGVINDVVRDTLRELSRSDPEKLLLIDSRTQLGAFDFGVLKGNRREVAEAGGAKEEEEISSILRQLQATSGCPVVATLGEEGIAVAAPGGDYHHIESLPVRGPVDIVGAGDSVSSGIVCGRLGKADWPESVALGNLVASITIQQIGQTGTATPKQLLDRCRELDRQGE